MRQAGGGAAIMAALMLVAAQADAKCVPSKYTDSWLAEQEQLGGDTMQRHVGRSPSVLAAYLAEDPQTRSIGSFPDPRTAGALLRAALPPDEHSSASWARRPPAGARDPVPQTVEQQR